MTKDEEEEEEDTEKSLSLMIILLGYSEWRRLYTSRERRPEKSIQGSVGRRWFSSSGNDGE